MKKVSLKNVAIMVAIFLINDIIDFVVFTQVFHYHV